MAEVSRMLRVLFLVSYFVAVYGIPEQGKWVANFDNKNRLFGVKKSMYKGTKIALKVECKSDEDVKIDFSWLLRYSPCAEEFTDLNDDTLTSYLIRPNLQMITDFTYHEFEFIRNSTSDSCSSTVSLPDYTGVQPEKYFDNKLPNTTSGVKSSTSKKDSGKKAAATTTTVKPTTPAKTTAKPKTSKPGRKKRASALATPATAKPKTTGKKTQNVGDKTDKHFFLEVWTDGNYLFVLKLDSSDKFEAKVTIDMLGDHGYISAQDWPLLIFYGVMGLVYIIYGVSWLIMLACSWRDLLRVQFWIGGVIALGMLEKAVFYTEFQTVTNTGQSVRGAVIFAELVSCLKKSLARMLVIIVSLGFGIVKPRLGPTFKMVMGVGLFYFIVSSIEGCMRQLQNKGDNSKDILAAQVPLAVTDAIICWWIFSSLIKTTRTLRLRRNVVKLSLYRHFTNTLIFAVLASVIYMIWSLSQHKMKLCVTDWRELWVDEAFWHLLFSVILLVIMILWRPSANNQRYAFSPLLDAAEDEDEEPMLNDAFDGMKMRGVKSQQSNGSPKQRDGRSTIEEDLKWVEENIPSSIADKTLPSLLDDSDEEMMTAKYEVNKMQ